MASFSIHLAVGKRYIEKTSIIKDEKNFYRGVISPDLSLDKNSSHYTGSLDKTNLEKFLSQKVLLYNYLISNKIDNDYELGVFLHLVTDYIFFNYFFDKNYTSSTEYNKFNNDLYHSYDNTDDYVNKKYNIDYSDLKESIEQSISRARKNKKTSYSNGTDIIPKDKLDEFIEYTSNIDLYEYKNKILKYKSNVIPD